MHFGMMKFLQDLKLKSVSPEEKEENFQQTIVFIRKEYKKKLRSEAALLGVPYYVLLDGILAKVFENRKNQKIKTNQAMFGNEEQKWQKQK
jgi:hypothetical protein